MRLIDADALLRSTDKEAIHAWEIALAPTVFSDKDLIELEDRFGKFVRTVVEDMISGENQRWSTKWCEDKMDEEG